MARWYAFQLHCPLLETKAFFAGWHLCSRQVAIRNFHWRIFEKVACLNSHRMLFLLCLGLSCQKVRAGLTKRKLRWKDLQDYIEFSSEDQDQIPRRTVSKLRCPWLRCWALPHRAGGWGIVSSTWGKPRRGSSGCGWQISPTKDSETAFTLIKSDLYAILPGVKYGTWPDRYYTVAVCQHNPHPYHHKPHRLKKWCGVLATRYGVWQDNSQKAQQQGVVLEVSLFSLWCEHDFSIDCCAW